MGVRIVKVEPATYQADGDKVMVNPAVTHYSDNTSGHGLRYAVLTIPDTVGASPTARSKFARLVALLLNSDEQARRMIND